LILRKIIKTVATRCRILKLKCTKFSFFWGSVPVPAGGAYSAPQILWLDLTGLLVREGRRGRTGGRAREGRWERRGPAAKARAGEGEQAWRMLAPQTARMNSAPFVSLRSLRFGSTANCSRITIVTGACVVQVIIFEGQDKNPEMCRVLLTHEIMCRSAYTTQLARDFHT